MENQGISLIPEVPNIERQDTNSAAFESCLFPNIDCNAVVQEKYWNMYTPLESSTDTKIYTFVIKKTVTPERARRRRANSTANPGR